jgi:hypothetical protein
MCLLVWGCSSTGRLSYLEGDNSSAWQCGAHKDFYSTVGKVPVYKYESDSLSISVYSSQSEDQFYQPPYELGVRTMTLGPLWFPVIPNPVYIIRELFFPFSCRYAMWFEITSHDKLLTIDSTTINFYQISGGVINPTKTILFSKYGSNDFKREPVFNPTHLINNTVYVYFIFDFTKEDIKGVNIDCQNLSSNIPLLKTVYHVEWFYNFFSFRDMMLR